MRQDDLGPADRRSNRCDPVRHTGRCRVESASISRRVMAGFCAGADSRPPRARSAIFLADPIGRGTRSARHHRRMAKEFPTHAEQDHVTSFWHEAMPPKGGNHHPSRSPCPCNPAPKARAKPPASAPAPRAKTSKPPNSTNPSRPWRHTAKPSANNPPSYFSPIRISSSL
jgi:hypothetical protein